MGCRLLVLLVSSLLFLGPQASAQQSQQGSGESGAPQVASNAPVITLEGSCAAGTATHEGTAKSDGAGSDPAAAAATAPVSATPTDSGCKVVITRAEFEKLTNAMHPGSPSATRSLANHYSEMLLLAEKAHEAGYDQDPAIQAKARFTYLQIVGQGFSMQLREDARVVSDAEVEAYYKERPQMFEQVELMRIFIPSLKSYDPEPPHLSEQQLAADKTNLEAEARKIYAQALAGVSFERLEERAYKAAGNPEDTPPVNLGKLTRSAIPQQYSDMIFALKIGQISELTPESNGWSIFKVVSKRTMPLSEAKPQVQQLKADAALSAVKNSMKVNLNDAYFGPPGVTTNAPKMRR